jgi:hypothetical protein
MTFVKEPKGRTVLTRSTVNWLPSPSRSDG